MSDVQGQEQEQDQLDVGGALEQQQDSQNDAGGGGGGQVAQLQREVGGMDHSQGSQALRPGGQRTQPKPKKKKKSRAQILKEKKGSLDKIEDLMSYGAFDWAVTDKEADQAMGILQNMGLNERMVCIQALNGRNAKYVDRLIDNAPKGTQKSKAGAFLTVLSVSGKTKTIKGLLKQLPAAAGIRGGDAGAVGLTIRSLDSSDVAQYGKTQGHRFSDWLAFAPDSVQKSVGPIFQKARAEKQEAEAAAEQRKEQEAENDRKADATLAEDAGARKSLSDLEDLMSYGAFDWAITDKEARKALGIFNSLGPEQLQAVVYKLPDKFMDRFIDNLAPEDRWNNKRTFLRIISVRPPEKNVPYVRELLSYGVFDWAVTDEEARLAFQLVKAMPKDLRDQFQNHEEGKWWGRMEGNLAQEDKTAQDANFYDNAEDTQQLKLDFQQKAGSWEHGRLSTSIAMLTRMGEEDWVEAELQSKGFDQNPEYDWIYNQFGFARAGGERDPKKFGKFKEKTFLENAGEFFSAIGSGAKLLGKAIGNAIEAGVTGDAQMSVNLQDVQNVMGGDIMGIQLDEEAGKDANQVNADINLDTGIFSASIPNLAISSIAQAMGTTRVQTGAVQALDVNITAKFATEADGKEYFHISIGGVTANDIWFITEDAMTTAGKLSLSDFVLHAERASFNQPADQGMFTSLAISEIQETMQRLFGMLQLQDPKPEALGVRLGQSFSEMKADVSLGSLEVEDVADSAGGYAGSIAVSGVDASVQNQRKGSVARARLAELTGADVAPTAEEEAEIASLREVIGRMAPLERREQELMAKESEGTLELWEKEELTQIRDELTMTSTEVTISALEIENVDMAGVQAEQLSVKDAKAQVTASRETEDEQEAGGLDSEVQGTFEVGSISGTNLKLQGGNRLEAFDARIAQLKSKIDGGDGTAGDVTLLGELQAKVAPVHRKIVERDALRLIPAGERSADQQAQIEAYNAELSEWLGRADDTSVESFSASGVGGSLDAENGKTSLDIASMQASGIQSGGNSVDNVSASDVKVDADLGGDVREGIDPGAFENAAVSAEQLAASGIHQKGQRPSKALADSISAIELKSELGTASADELAALDGMRSKLSVLSAKEARAEALRAIVGDVEAGNPTATITASKLNVRSGPGSKNSKVGLVSGGAQLEVLGREGEWLNVLYEGQPAWVHGGYAKVADHVPAGPEAAELAALEAELAATDLSISSFTASDASASFDATTGEAKVGASNVEAEGVQQGDMSIDKASMGRVDASVNLGPGIPSADSLKENGFSANATATDVNVSGVQKGKPGEAGSMSLDSASIDSVTAGYDSNQEGGKATVDVTGASMEGFEMASNTLASLEGAIGALNAKGNTEGLNEDEEVQLGKLQAQLAEYHELKAKHDGEKNGWKKRQLAKELETWEETSSTLVASATLHDLHGEVTGIGNLADETNDPTQNELGVKVSSTEGLHAEGIQAGGNRVKSVDVKGVDVTGTNVLNEEGRHVEASVDSVKGKGYRGDGVGASSFKANDIDATLDGTTASADIKYAGAGGAYGSGATVGYAGVGGVHVDVNNVGKEDQSISGSAASVRARNVKHKTGDTESSIDKVRAQGTRFSMDAAGNVSGGARNFSGEGVQVTQGKDDEQSTYGVESFKGKDASVNMRGDTMNASVGSVSAENVTASGAATKGHDVLVEKVNANGIVASSDSATGDFSAQVKDAGATGIHASRDGEEIASVKTAQLDDINAAGNSKDGSAGATVGSATATGITYEDGARGATIEEVTAKDLQGGIDANGQISGSFGTIEGDTLRFHDNTDPENKLRGVMTAFSMGSEDAASTFSMDDAGKITADLRTINIGAGSEFHFGKGGADSAKFFDEVSAGRIELQDFNPADVTEAGSTLIVSEINGERILYDTATRKAFIRGASIDTVFAKGMGNDEVVAGFSGMEADKLNYQESDASGDIIRKAEITNANLPGGYAVLRQGESFDVAFAKVAGVEAGNITADLYLKPEAEQDKEQASSDETRDVPGLGTVKLDALRHMNGNINVEIRDGIMKGVYGAVAEIPVRNGKIHLEDLHIEVDNFGPNITFDGSRFDRWVLRKAAKKYAKVQNDTIDVADFLEAMAMAQADAGAESSDEDNTELMSKVKFGASINNVRGDVQVGENSARIESGDLAASGKLGEQVNATITDAKVTRIRVEGGIGVDEVTAKRIETAVINPLSEEKRVTVKVVDGKVGEVLYNPSNASSGSQKKADEVFEEMTSTDGASKSSS